MSMRLGAFAALVAGSVACSAGQSSHIQAPAPMMGMAGGGMMGMAGARMTCMGGDSATAAQMRVIHELTVNHARISRTVTNLPDGIRTVTESDDPQLAGFLRDHVATMDDRVRRGDDPGLPMESPALISLFRDREKIRTTMEPTAKGVLLVQTSKDPGVVAALQQHAAEVSDLAARGMTAMREVVMRHGGWMVGPAVCADTTASAEPARPR